jgi:hypothetical protein
MNYNCNKTDDNTLHWVGYDAYDEHHVVVVASIGEDSFVIGDFRSRSRTEVRDFVRQYCAEWDWGMTHFYASFNKNAFEWHHAKINL